MLKYITVKEYTELLGAESIPNNMDNLIIQASNYINKQTMGRIDKDNVPEQVKYVTCLIIKLLSEQETKLNEVGNLKSENIEGWSKTYVTPEEVKQDYSNKMRTTLSTYLWDVIGTDGNPLLYCGVC